jgi:hypothetical protein
LGDRLNRVIVGLALKNELYNKRANPTLMTLYARPELGAIKNLHDSLLPSHDHRDREVAFWLELALDQPPIHLDLQDVRTELTEMEVLLYDLVLRADGESQRGLNDWMNYVANVPQSLQDGRGLDAKVLISLAVQSSRSEAVERRKRDPLVRYKIEILQKETARLFEVIKRIPLRLNVAEEQVDALEQVQDILIDALQRSNLTGAQEELNKALRYPIQKLEASQRYLMRSDVQRDLAKKEMGIACEYLKQHMKTMPPTANREWMKRLLEKTQQLLQSLDDPRCTSE